jgi:hypothetical protein
VSLTVGKKILQLGETEGFVIVKDCSGNNLSCGRSGSKPPTPSGESESRALGSRPTLPKGVEAP